MSKNNNKEIKVETIEEYLARGGEIEVLAPEEQIVTKAKHGKTKHGPPNLMSLEEGEFWFGEKKTRRRKKKVPDFSKVDMSLVPEDLLADLGLNKDEGTEKGTETEPQLSEEGTTPEIPEGTGESSSETTPEGNGTKES